MAKLTFIKKLLIEKQKKGPIRVVDSGKPGFCPDKYMRINYLT